MAIGTQIPAQIVQTIVPILSKRMSLISTLAEKIISDCVNLPVGVSCDDPSVRNIKQQLKNLQTAINTINPLLSNINNIINIIQTVVTVATILKTIQLAIPSVPGVPAGPITELIIIFTKLIENSKSCIDSLKGLTGSSQSQFNRIDSLIADAINKIGSICSNEQFEVSANVADIISRSSNQGNTQNLQQPYNTEFYTSFNVSDDDIEYRLKSIQDLLDNQLDVMQNLIESPSKVLRGQQLPTDSIGNINDYFVDTRTNIVYGPKTDAGW